VIKIPLDTQKTAPYTLIGQKQCLIKLSNLEALI
jgi:hypothetical protein